MTEYDNQIRTNVHQMLLDLWPDNPDNLKNLPPQVDRHAWFEQFITEKRQDWEQKQELFLQYGRQEEAHKESIKLEQLELTLKELNERRN